MDYEYIRVVVKDKPFEYRVGFRFVTIKGEYGTMLVDLATLTGKSWQTIERSRRKSGIATSKMVVEWIRSQMRKGEDNAGTSVAV